MTISDETLKRCGASIHEGENPLPLTAFYRAKTASDGLQSSCKKCIARRAKAWRHAQRDKRRAEREASKEERRLAREEREQLQKEEVRRRYVELRARVFAHYGEKCACCGRATDLTIDHVDGDGAEQRAEQGTGLSFYRWLEASGFPPGFQSLCQPCNSSKHRGPVCMLHADREVLRLRAEVAELKRRLALAVEYGKRMQDRLAV